LPNIKSTFATIFKFRTDNNRAVIKCFEFTEESTDNKIANAIKEYCLMKIASILKIGPKIIKIFGFDLVVSDHCI